MAQEIKNPAGKKSSRVCERGESNPSSLAATRPSTWRVYQFRHSRVAEKRMRDIAHSPWTCQTLSRSLTVVTGSLDEGLDTPNAPRSTSAPRSSHRPLRGRARRVGLEARGGLRPLGRRPAHGRQRTARPDHRVEVGLWIGIFTLPGVDMGRPLACAHRAQPPRASKPHPTSPSPEGAMRGAWGARRARVDRQRADRTHEADSPIHLARNSGVPPPCAARRGTGGGVCGRGTGGGVCGRGTGGGGGGQGVECAAQGVECALPPDTVASGPKLHKNAPGSSHPENTA